MKLYHVTLNENVESIRKGGLDPAKSMGKLKAVWLCTEANIGWAIAHVAAKNNVAPQGLAVFAVNVDHKRVRRTSKPGIWTCKTVIKPGNPPINAAAIISADRE